MNADVYKLEMFHCKAERGVDEKQRLKFIGLKILKHNSQLWRLLNRRFLRHQSLN